MNEDQLLTPAQVAERLQIPLATLYRWRTRGVGPVGFRVGRHTRYRASELERFIAGMERLDSAVVTRGGVVVSRGYPRDRLTWEKREAKALKAIREGRKP